MFWWQRDLYLSTAGQLWSTMYRWGKQQFSEMKWIFPWYGLYRGTAQIYRLFYWEKNDQPLNVRGIGFFHGLSDKPNLYKQGTGAIFRPCGHQFSHFHNIQKKEMCTLSRFRSFGHFPWQANHAQNAILITYRSFRVDSNRVYIVAATRVRFFLSPL